MRIFGLAALAALLWGSPAMAQVRPLLDPPASAEAARGGVEVYLLNEGATPAPAQGPAEIETIARDGAKLRLIAAPDGAQTIAAGGFARVHYRLAASTPVAVAAAPPPPVEVTSGETVAVHSAGLAAAFVHRFQPYEPIYGVFGAGSDGAKLQVSFDFRLLGRADGPRLDFAYTQAMFWATDLPSGPFRATNYSPEVFADLPLGDSAAIGLGYRHDSNGGGANDSVDANRVYLRARKDFALGGDWTLSLSPSAWIYVARPADSPDLERYWGSAGLAASLGQQGGLKLAVSGKGNFSTGRGQAEAFVSWPVVRIFDRLPHFYLFGQVFTGFGEALSDYDRRSTRARIGVALTR